jgi:hypothetical protein
MIGAAAAERDNSVDFRTGRASLQRCGKAPESIGLTSVMRSGVPEPAIISSMAWASRKKPMPKKAAMVAVATSPMETRWRRVPTESGAVAVRRLGAGLRRCSGRNAG